MKKVIIVITMLVIYNSSGTDTAYREGGDVGKYMSLRDCVFLSGGGADVCGEKSIFCE